MITLLSPAKINLTLDVKSKTPGALFHELDTLYQKVAWGDELSIETAAKFTLEGDFSCPTYENLIYQAWQLIPDRKAVRVKVKKQIPEGGGLGGGSSNAAIFVLAYYQLFNLGPLPEALIQQLASLGKDIPFFLQPDAIARGTHYGEIIEPVDFNFSGQTIYLYFPDHQSHTAQAYATLKDFNTTHTAHFLDQPNLKRCGNTFEQNFEQKKYSNIHLSGSGSTWFSFKKLNLPHHQRIETHLA